MRGIPASVTGGTIDPNLIYAELYSSCKNKIASASSVSEIQSLLTDFCKELQSQTGDDFIKLVTGIRNSIPVIAQLQFEIRGDRAHSLHSKEIDNALMLVPEELRIAIYQALRKIAVVSSLTSNSTESLGNDLRESIEIQRVPSKSEIFRELILNESSQSEKVSLFLQDYRESLDQIFDLEPIIIGDNIFLGSSFVDGETKMKIVLQKSVSRESEEKSPIWSLRFFRLSESDLQPKAIFGAQLQDLLLGQKGYHLLKGNVSDPEFHYATSGKIPKELGEYLSDFKKVRSEYDYLKYCEDFTTATQEPYTIKNPTLRNAISQYKDLYNIILNFPRGRNNFEILDRINDPNTRTFLEDLISKNLPNNNKIIEKFLLDKFSTIQIIPCPSFDSDLPVRSYRFGDVRIEEFRVNTPEGDSLIFCMGVAYDGTVYVDRICSEPRGITEYGTESSIVNAGFLTYKPHDYYHQLPVLSTEQISSKYVSLKPTYDLIPLIVSYRKSLERRNLMPIVYGKSFYADFEALRDNANRDQIYEEVASRFKDLNDFKLYFTRKLSGEYIEDDKLEYCISDIEEIIYREDSSISEFYDVFKKVFPIPSQLESRLIDIAITRWNKYHSAET